jgi:glycosyltransferase involved in cell wall biosynthesis
MSKIYFDYSTMVDWVGAPTGIPRTVYQLSLAMRNSVSYVHINDELGRFHDYDYERGVSGKPIKFSNGDWLISTGATWAYACFPSVVAELRNNEVRYAQLFYDLIPFLFPYMYEDHSFGAYYVQHLCDMLNLCDHAFAISKSTKSDLLRECEVNHHAAIDVIRLGDEISTEAGEEGENLNSVITALDDFILTVGTIEYRKNHKVIIDAYRLLVAEGKQDLPLLVIVGREGFMNNELVYQAGTDPVLKNHVRIFNSLTDAELDYLYRHCLFTVYPAHYEGWGLPIAESLRYGKQCIVSNSSSMKEIAPDLTRFAHPLQVEQWANNIEELTSNRDLLKKECIRISNEYNVTKWSDCANQIIDPLLS